MNKTVVVTTALILLTACANAAGRSSDDALDDARIGPTLGHFTYKGEWQHVTGFDDGRYDGTSSRSRHADDSITLPFQGSAVRVYGVRGPNGGDAAIAIDGRYYGLVTFYSPRKEVRDVVFTSPRLAEGKHTFGLVVEPAAASDRSYVNIDEVEILHQH